MAQSDEKFTSPTSLVVDLILVVAFFAFMFGVLKSHVPSSNPKMITLWAALGTSCMTGVFWLALQMFRVVFRAYRAAQK
jgi:cytochrome b561